jgi:hypothetical protein
MSSFLSESNIKLLSYLLRKYLPEALWYNDCNSINNDAIHWFRNQGDSIRHLSLDDINNEFIKYIINIHNFSTPDVLIDQARDPNLIQDYFEPIPSCNTEIYDNDLSCRKFDLGHALATGEFVPSSGSPSDCSTTAEILDEVKCGELRLKDFLDDSEYQDVARNIFRARHSKTDGKKEFTKRRYIAPESDYSECQKEYPCQIRKKFELSDTNTSRFSVCPRAPQASPYLDNLNKETLRSIEDEEMFNRSTAANILGPYHLRNTGVYNDELNTLGSAIAPDPMAYTEMESLHGKNKGLVKDSVIGKRYNSAVYQIGQENNPRYNPKSIANQMSDAIKWTSVYRPTAPEYKKRLLNFVYDEQNKYNDSPRMPICTQTYCGSNGYAQNMYNQLYGYGVFSGPDFKSKKHY